MAFFPEGHPHPSKNPSPRPTARRAFPPAIFKKFQKIQLDFALAGPRWTFPPRIIFKVTTKNQQLVPNSPK
jgi:hypothetical protein